MTAKPALPESVDRLPIWDNHACLPLRADESFINQVERYHRAGVDIVSLNVGYGQSSWSEHLEVLSFMRRWFSERKDQYCLISTVDDILACKRNGQLGITFDVEGMVPVQDQPFLVQTFYELGVRWMLIAYNRSNRAGGGCMDEDQGLTEAGRRVIDEMERVGMVLCLSHSGERTVRDALEYVTAPPIFSHSNPRGVFQHERNISDAMICACAAKGGVIGLSGIGAFLGTGHQLVAALLDQLRYVIDLVGPSHVGLGLDYVFDTDELEASVRAHPELYPPGVNGTLAMVAPEDMPAIAEGLARDNLKEDEIGLILGGNWLRIARAVWK